MLPPALEPALTPALITQDLGASEAGPQVNILLQLPQSSETAKAFKDQRQP